MRRWTGWLPTGICAILAAGWAVSAWIEGDPAIPDGAVARVGDRLLTPSDVAALGAFRLDIELPADMERTRLNDAIDLELLVQEALARGLEREDLVVRRRLAMRVVEDDILVPLSFEIDDRMLRRHYETNLDRYSGPAGPIPLELCRSRVRGDLTREIFTPRFEALTAELRRRYPVTESHTNPSTNDTREGPAP